MNVRDDTDSNGDGLLGVEEIKMGTDPNKPRLGPGRPHGRDRVRPGHRPLRSKSPASKLVGQDLINCELLDR